MKLSVVVQIIFILALSAPAFAADGSSIGPPDVFTIPDDATEEQLAVISNKMSCYVQVLNDFGTMQVVDTMNNRLEMLRGRKPGDKWQIRNQTNGYGPRFDAALQNNKKLTPRMEPADTVMDQLADVYPRLLATVAELDKYYERGDNKDDGEKKGQELGKQLKADFDIFMAKS